MTTVTAMAMSALEIRIGYASGDGLGAVAKAADIVSAALAESVPDMAIVVTAGEVAGDVVGVLRAALGPVGITGGAMPALLTDRGPLTAGAIVIAIANADGAASGVASMGGRDLPDAAGGAARMVLAGWPFRARYPRGIGVAFGRAGAGEAPAFLTSWREFMGPKLRTVCSVTCDRPVYGMSSAAPRVSVGCLEAAYATGLGYADAAGTQSAHVPADTLIHGAADATLTAVKRLEGRPPRLVLVVESAARHRSLGDAAGAEWAAIRAQVDESAPCIGWVCDGVAAYGRGVQPTAADDALIVLALGDSPRS